MNYIDERTEILNLLCHRINSFSEGYRQNIAIIGEPFSGKTAIIEDLVSKDKINTEKIIPLYIEIKIEPFEFFAKRFVKSSLYQLMKSDSLVTMPQESVVLMEDLYRTFPKTAQLCTRVLQDVEKNKFDEAFSFMLDIPMAIYEETKKRCVLILDEFHNLENFVLKNPFSLFTKKIMIQKDTMYILLSSRNTLSEKLLNEKLSMLFGNFEKIILKPFDINMSRRFLNNHINIVKLPSIYLDFIAAFMGNNPFYMKILSEEIERVIASKKVPLEDYAGIIEESFTSAIFKKQGVINQHFFNLLFTLSEGKLLSRSTAVLISLASDNKKQQDIIKASKLQSRDVSKILSKLMEMDILVRNGSFYRFKNRVFGFWIGSVYLKKILSFSLQETLEEAIFRKDIKRRLEVYMQEFKKELSSRILELFKLFKNDIIQLNGRKHKFLLFDEVNVNEEKESGVTSLIAISGKNKWMSTIKKDFVTENDVSDMIEKMKMEKKHNRLKRHIIISLGGINENAYLMAKEANFWVWDTDSLNVLMELYSKPHVI